MPNIKEEIVLGIDPGYARLGFGVIQNAPSSGHTTTRSGKIKVLDFGVIQTRPSQSHSARLLIVQTGVQKIIEQYNPKVLVVEKIFFSKNQKTVIQVAESRGVVLVLAAGLKIPVIEFTPSEVKMAITGSGRADKREIQQMVKILCNLPELPQPDDAADGLAIALTYIHQLPFQQALKRSTRAIT